MNIRVVSIIFVLAILVLLIFQSVWLYNAYQMGKKSIQTHINMYLANAVDEELIIRQERNWTAEDSLIYDPNVEDYLQENPETTYLSVDLNETVKTNFFQHLMLFSGFPLNLSMLDSIFSRKMTDTGYFVDYLLTYKDSVGEIKDYVGNLDLSENPRTFISDSYPIVGEDAVNVYANISVFSVLGHMLSLVIVSFCLFLVLLCSLVYIIRYAYNQYRLNKLRDDFSHALIHDLKSPLNTIYIALSNYKNGLFEKNSSFYLKSTDVALLQVLNIQALVDRILSIARFEEKKMEMVRTAVNLPKMIGEIVDNYSVSVKKAVVFEPSFHLNDKPVYMDEMLIRQAISNLVDNAIKYSGDSVKIEIACEEKENKVYIQVKDNGIGISLKYQELIFNKFERGGAIFRRGAKGFGLGLNYVKHVALAHQGTIACYSRQGEGSTFTMLIPSLLREMKRDDLEPLETAIVSH